MGSSPLMIVNPDKFLIPQFPRLKGRMKKVLKWKGKINQGAMTLSCSPWCTGPRRCCCGCTPGPCCPHSAAAARWPGPGWTSCQSRRARGWWPGPGRAPGGRWWPWRPPSAWGWVSPCPPGPAEATQRPGSRGLREAWNGIIRGEKCEKTAFMAWEKSKLQQFYFVITTQV
mgnify:CR=1 FL=1